YPNLPSTALSLPSLLSLAATNLRLYLTFSPPLFVKSLPLFFSPFFSSFPQQSFSLPPFVSLFPYFQPPSLLLLLFFLFPFLLLSLLALSPTNYLFLLLPLLSHFLFYYPNPLAQHLC